MMKQSATGSTVSLRSEVNPPCFYTTEADGIGTWKLLASQHVGKTSEIELLVKSMFSHASVLKQAMESNCHCLKTFHIFYFHTSE